MRTLFVLLTFTLFLIACKDRSGKKQEEQATTDSTKSTQVPKPVDDSALLALTDEVLLSIKNKNYDSLALFIHPTEGIRFSPNAFVDTTINKKFSAEDFKKDAGMKKQGKITWGYYDATGDPMNLTIDEYFKKFVYDVDFMKPEIRKVNEFIGSGNSLNNLQTIYEGCDFTESHFSGFDKKFDGMDWRSLRLVFKMKDDKYYLVGIIHDEWTT